MEPVQKMSTPRRSISQSRFWQLRIAERRALLVIGDFPAHQLEEVALEIRHQGTQLLQRGERDLANGRCLQGLGRRGMRIVADAVHAENLSREVKAGDLLATVIGMSLAYVASLAGLLLAWWSWKRRRKEDRDD